MSNTRQVLLDEEDLNAIISFIEKKKLKSKNPTEYADIFTPWSFIQILARFDCSRDVLKKYVEYYKTCDAFLSLERKVEKKEELTREEFICHALTTRNITSLSYQKLMEVTKEIEKEHIWGVYYSLLCIKMIISPVAKDFGVLIKGYSQNASYINLAGGDLRHMPLHECNFSYSNLSNTNFSDAYLGGASLKGADASGAIFRNTSLVNTCMLEANFDAAYFADAHFIDNRDYGWAEYSGWKIQETLTTLSQYLPDHPAINIALAREFCKVLRERYLQQQQVTKLQIVDAVLKFFRDREGFGVLDTLKGLFGIFKTKVPSHHQVLLDFRQEIVSGQYRDITYDEIVDQRREAVLKMNESNVKLR